MNPNDYIIEASVNGKNWKYMASFNKGDRSRFGEDYPFNENVAVMEARSFKEARGKEFPYVRVIINI